MAASLDKDMDDLVVIIGPLFLLVVGLALVLVILKRRQGSGGPMARIGPAMTQATSLNQASHILCRQSLELCRTAKAKCSESKEAGLESKHALEASAAQRLLRKNYLALNGTLIPMKLKLFLDNDSYECLLNHVAPGLSRAAILEAVLLGNTRVVDCDDHEALELLLCVKSHCPSAVDRIAEAIRAAGIII
jgi:hypothetical protein